MGKKDEAVFRELRKRGVRKRVARDAAKAARTGDDLTPLTTAARDLRAAAAALDERAQATVAAEARSGGPRPQGPVLPGQPGAVKTRARTN